MQPFLSALLFNVAALGQSRASLPEQSSDPSGAAVPDATVRLEMSGRTIDEFRTASDGRFEFKATRPVAAHRCHRRRLRAGRRAGVGRAAATCG